MEKFDEISWMETKLDDGKARKNKLQVHSEPYTQDPTAASWFEEMAEGPAYPNVHREDRFAGDHLWRRKVRSTVIRRLKMTDCGPHPDRATVSWIWLALWFKWVHIVPQPQSRYKTLGLSWNISDTVPSPITSHLPSVADSIDCGTRTHQNPFNW